MDKKIIANELVKVAKSLMGGVSSVDIKRMLEQNDIGDVLRALSDYYIEYSKELEKDVFTEPLVYNAEEIAKIIKGITAKVDSHQQKITRATK